MMQFSGRSWVFCSGETLALALPPSDNSLCCICAVTLCFAVVTLWSSLCIKENRSVPPMTKRGPVGSILFSVVCVLVASRLVWCVRCFCMLLRSTQAMAAAQPNARKPLPNQAPSEFEFAWLHKPKRLPTRSCVCAIPLSRSRRKDRNRRKCKLHTPGRNKIVPPLDICFY